MMQPAYLQGWVDFNADGDWADAGEKIIADFPIAPGFGTYTVPYSTPIIQVSTSMVTYARFRLSMQQGLGFSGPASTGEVEDYLVKLDPLKWLQPPDLTTNGVDVDNEFELADDFLCTQTGPITDIHIWGSFRNDYDGMDPAYLTNLSFVVKIYSDVPKSETNAYSRPGHLKWQRVFLPGQYRAGRCAQISAPGEWWHSPPVLWQPGADRYCYQYDFYIDRTNAFRQSKSNIYWLSVQCVGQSAPQRFGWKSTYLTNRWNDDAVWWDTTVPVPTWRELRYGDGHPYAQLMNNSLDLAFAISTEAEEEPAYDFGDAPDAAQGTGPGDYQTRLADNGAYHNIVAGAPYFDDVTQTDQPDAEADGQPNPTATGDDLNGANPDDEDGIIIPPLTAGQPGQVTITVAGGAGGGFVDAWIDFNADGDWTDPGEQIFSGWLPAGQTTIGFAVPPGAALGQTFGRFRINSVAAGLLPTGGPAQDGEVEDHAVFIEAGAQFDFGDAPDGAQGTGPGDYQTTLADNGAYHTILGGAPYFDDGTLTDQPDAEPDGQPDSTATGDDLNGAKPDDEDGIIIPPLTAGQPGQVTITVAGGAGGGFVDAWIDFNADGDWTDPGEQIWSGWLAAGPNVIAFVVPPGAAVGQTFARFRINSVAAGLLPTGGPAQDGEVEDHALIIEGEPQLDFGDAPDPAYPTLLPNGARHVIGQLFLGASVDAEPNGQPDPNALGDDNNPPAGMDDEDGVTFTTALISGVPAKVRVVASAPGLLQGWIDWNQNGSWAEANEQIIVNRPVVAGANTIQFSVPNNLPSGKTFARFRLSTVAGLSYTGLAPDGEVEDYEVTLYPLKWLQPPEQGSQGVDVSNGRPLADDFLCTESGPITDIHLWGSFLNDMLPVGGPGNMTLTLTIYADVPVGPGNPYPWSHPGAPLWTMTFNPGQYSAANNYTTPEWWHDPATGQWLQGADTNMYQFDFYIDPTEAFKQVEGTIYWLGVSNTSGTANFSFGWKTTYLPWNDDACWLDATGVWRDLHYGGGHPWSPQSLDLAFALSGAESLYELDFGDAPSPYPTLLPTGARHFAVPGFRLGLAEDTEANGQPQAQALGDDLNGAPDDEDGVVFSPPLLAGTQACVNVTLTGPSGLLDAWVDFNQNGIWGDVANEQIFASQSLVSGPNPGLCFNVPTNAVLGTNVARFRLSSAGGLLPTGLAQDGEVEDYEVVILQRAPLTNIVITNIVVTNLAAGTNVVLLQWNAEVGVQYQVQAAVTFSNAPPFVWNDVGPVFLGPANTYVETNSPALERYYRVKTPFVWP